MKLPDSTRPPSGATRRHTAGLIDPDGTIVELVYSPASGRTGFAIWSGDAWRLSEEFTDSDGRCWTPTPSTESLIRHRVVLLAEEPKEYEDTKALLAAIREFLRRYVSLSLGFEVIAAHYVLLSWIYDGYNELPYLRVRGQFGSGKTRFLIALGSISYKTLFASGASTLAPIYHTLDTFNGTLALDEADFRWSDEKAEIAKILNNGNARGFPVLRMEGSSEGGFRPRAFRVYGPKIVASRGDFEDSALESRFITADMHATAVEQGVPLSLPESFHTEAHALRNQLLLYRFRNRLQLPALPSGITPGVPEPRLRQIFAPLLALAEEAADRRVVVDFMEAMSRELAIDRGMAIEGQLIDVLLALVESRPSGAGIPLREAANALRARLGGEEARSVTNRNVGALVRRRLLLSTRKSHGVYVIPWSEMGKLRRLSERYGTSTRAAGDAGDTDPGATG